MEYSVIQVLLVFVVTFIAAIDQFSFLESLYQPIVTGMVVGLILGDVTTGLIVGGTYQLMTIGNMPIGGAHAPTPSSAASWLRCSRSPWTWTRTRPLRWPSRSRCWASMA